MFPVAREFVVEDSDPDSAFDFAHVLEIVAFVVVHVNGGHDLVGVDHVVFEGRDVELFLVVVVEGEFGGSSGLVSDEHDGEGFFDKVWEEVVFDDG